MAEGWGEERERGDKGDREMGGGERRRESVGGGVKEGEGIKETERWGGEGGV